MTVKNALTVIKVLDLNPDQYVIMGAAALAAHGLISWKEVQDLEILAQDGALKTIRAYGVEIIAPVSGDTGCALFGDMGRAYERWVGSFRDGGQERRLINRGTVINGLKYGSPADVVRVYLELGREKYSHLIDSVIERINSDSLNTNTSEDFLSEILPVLMEFGFTL